MSPIMASRAKGRGGWIGMIGSGYSNVLTRTKAARPCCGVGRWLKGGAQAEEMRVFITSKQETI
jgi:hypothetical protein